MKVKICTIIFAISIALCACGTSESEQGKVNDVTEIGENMDTETVETEESVLAEESKKTISFMVEGMEEMLPATIYEGKDYTILIPEKGWEMIGTGCWMSQDNNNVQFWITEYPDKGVSDVVKPLTEDSGFTVSGQDPCFLSRNDTDGTITNVRFFEGNDKVIGIFYRYPEKMAEGFGVRMRAIVDTFEWN